MVTEWRQSPKRFGGGGRAFIKSRRTLPMEGVNPYPRLGETSGYFASNET